MSTFAIFAERFAAAVGDAVQQLGRGGDRLDDLDDRMLADIGVSRSEIGSIEAEAHSASQPTRLRIVAETRHA